MVIRSAHVPKRCAAGLQDVRISNRYFGTALDDGATAVAGHGRTEAFTRHEVRSIRASPEGVCVREMTFALRPVPNRCAAGLIGAKDRISYIYAELDDGALYVAGYGRPETY